MIEPREPSKTDEMEESVRGIVAEAIEEFENLGADVHKSETSTVSAVAMAYELSYQSMLTRGASPATAHRVALLVCGVVLFRFTDVMPMP